MYTVCGHLPRRRIVLEERGNQAAVCSNSAVGTDTATMEEPTWAEWFERTLKNLEENGVEFPPPTPAALAALKIGPISPETHALWTTLPR